MRIPSEDVDSLSSSTSSLFQPRPTIVPRRHNCTDLNNAIFLMEARRQHETYEEMKRLLIFAGVFFLFAIAFVLMRFQVSIDDIIKWSPVIWLLGIVICGLLMNLLLQFRRILRARREKRERERRNFLNSIRLPNSFPCLAPAGSHCCQRHQMIGESGNPPEAELPTYEQIGECPLLSPPAFVLKVQRPKLDKPPPKYNENGVDGESLNSGIVPDEQPPSYGPENVTPHQ